MKYDPEQLERFMLAALTGVCANTAFANMPEHEVAYCALAYARESVQALKDQLADNEVTS